MFITMVGVSKFGTEHEGSPWIRPLMEMNLFYIVPFKICVILLFTWTLNFIWKRNRLIGFIVSLWIATITGMYSFTWIPVLVVS